MKLLTVAAVTKRPWRAVAGRLNSWPAITAASQRQLENPAIKKVL